MSKIKGVLMILLLAIVSGSCDINQINFDDVQEPTLNSVIAFPLGETTYKLSELLEELNDTGVEFQYGEDSLVFIVYQDTVTYTTQDDIISVGNIVNGDTLAVPVQVPVTQPTTVSVNPSEQSFEYRADNNEIITSAEYAEGFLELEVSSNIGLPVSYSLIVQNTTLNEVPILFEGDFTAPNTGNNSRALPGHLTQLLETQNGSNQFIVDFAANIQLDSGQRIPENTEIRYTLTYRDQVFDIIYGYFGRDTVSAGEASTDVSFFEELGEGGLTFGNPQINLSFENEIGIPVGIDLSTIYGLADNGNGTFDTTFLEGNITRNPQEIGFPTEYVEGDPAVSTSTIQINGFNSTINNIFRESPSQLVFDVTAITNPAGQTVENFYTDGLDINTFVEVFLPMSIQMRDLRREVEFELPGDFDVDFTDSVVVRLATENLLPFSTTAQIQFLNDNDSILFNSTEELVIATPFLNSNFIAVEAEENTADIPVPQEGIAALNEATKVKLVLLLSTPQSLNSRNIFVDLLARYSIVIKASLVGKLDVKL